jgi:N-acetylmuramoyl-L-alanine amidase
MFGRFADKAVRQRKDILRRVYEHNLHLNAGGPSATRWHRVGRRYLAALALAGGLLGGNLFNVWREPAQTSPIVASAASETPAPVTVATGAITPASVPEPVSFTSEPTTAAAKAVGSAAEEAPAPLLAGNENVRKLFGLSVKTIVLDAGHGGHDPGAVGKDGMQEKDITLDLALRLRARLEALDRSYRILLVRDEDVFVPLGQRADYANSQNADLFVSIHVNYLPSRTVDAIETYYFGRHQDMRARKVAERENQGSDYRLSDFESLVRNMQDTIKLQESQALARSIQRSLVTNIRRQNEELLNLGVRTAPFVVLMGVKAPSVLVEVASLSSPQGERNLGRERYRDQVASYLAAGIKNYLGEQSTQERRNHDKGKVGLAERQ